MHRPVINVCVGVQQHLFLGREGEQFHHLLLSERAPVVSDERGLVQGRLRSLIHVPTEPVVKYAKLQR